MADKNGKVICGTVDGETLTKLDAWRLHNFNLSYGEIVRQGVALFVREYIDDGLGK